MADDEIPTKIADGVQALLSERICDFDVGTLILLPVRLGDRGRAQYRESQLLIPKELRHFGVPAEFLNSPDERVGLSEFSSEVVVAFAFGVAQNMTWDTAKATVQYLFAKLSGLTKDGKSPVVHVSVARVARPDGTLLEGVEVRGPANDDTAARIIRALTGDSSTPSDH